MKNERLDIKEEDLPDYIKKNKYLKTPKYFWYNEPSIV
jgi:hypothetical protein